MADEDKVLLDEETAGQEPDSENASRMTEDHTDEGSASSKERAEFAQPEAGAESAQVEDSAPSEGTEEESVQSEEEEASPLTEGEKRRYLWYVVHTYSGYENKVKANLQKAIENRHLEEQILEIRIPMQDVVEVKNGRRRPVQRKMFPGYVLVNMDMNDDTWYVVRNTRGVTGFVGPGSKPVPLSDAEIKPLGIKTETISVDFGVGDEIAVIAGVWKDTTGYVQRMDYGKQSATINVELFGRETPVEISFAEVMKLDR